MSSNLAECVPEWYAAFADVDQDVLFELVLAANYLDFKPLLDLACAKVASVCKGKSIEDVRKSFGIASDVSPEEEAQIAEEPTWIAES